MSEGPTRESVQAACAAMREGFTLEGYSVEMAS
jgi:hypothetical protein